MPATVTLPALLTLFKIDRDLNQLRVGLDNVQKDQKRQETKIAQLSKELETQDLAHKKLQAEINNAYEQEYEVPLLGIALPDSTAYRVSRRSSILA